MSAVAVEIVDVGPRDGLQNAPRTVAPALRAELCARIAAAGVRRIEAVSFVHPGRVPQMADAEGVIAALPGTARDGVRYCGLVLNRRGYDRLRDCGLGELRYALAVSDAFNRRNSNASTDSALEAGREILGAAKRDGVHSGVILATAFGCPFSGSVDPGAAIAIAAELVAAGAEEVVFADTIGVATPGRVRALLEAGSGLGAEIGAHFHNTRNSGYANAYAALESGARILDASAGGLGGCPFAPAATGNIATEDLVYMLERDGIETGVDLEAMKAAVRWLGEATGFELDGQLHRVEPFPPLVTAAAP